MSPSIKAVCPKCQAEIGVPYILLGVPTCCLTCGSGVVPKVPVGTIYPRTEYQITFADFEQLISAESYRSSIGDLLSDWYDYQIIADGDSAVVKSEKGEHVNLVRLHDRIQKDQAKQREIYRAAMALWR